jgi:hypothetical protein
MLAVPGSAVPSERVASTAGNIVTPKRSRLSPDTVQKFTLGCLNWKFIEKLPEEERQSLTDSNRRSDDDEEVDSSSESE